MITESAIFDLEVGATFLGMALLAVLFFQRCVDGDFVLPFLTNQKMNAYLKEIADACGITKNLTFHLAPHTFSTMVTLSYGVPLETVSKTQ